MRSLFTLTLLLALVGTGYADTLTVQVDRDNGTTQVTDKLALTPANLGAATAAQGALADTAVQAINVTRPPYNADRTGAADTTTALTAAISAASALGGGTVYLPQGKYRFTPPLTLPPNVKLLGDGFSTDNGYTNAAATILSVGTTYDGPAVVIGNGTAMQYGNGVENLTISLNDKARGGLYLNAAVSGYYKNVFVLGSTTGSAPTYAQYGYNLTTTATTGLNINTMFNTFTNVQAAMVNNILKTGYNDHGNVCHNSFINFGGAYYTDGIELVGTDNNNFSMVYLFNRPGATGYGVKITHGGANDSAYFYQLQAGSGVYVGSNASAVIYGYDMTNGQPAPVLQDGTAKLTWTSDSANSTGWHLAGDIFVTGNFKDGTNTKTLAGLLPTATNFSGVLDATKGGTGVTDLSFTGASHKVPSVSGSPSAGCATWDNTGVLASTGTACGTGDNTGGITGLTGDVTASGSGSVAATVIQGSTTQAGKVQLTDSTSSTSTTTAATPNSVKTAYDLANAALPKSGGTATGNVTIQRAGVIPQFDLFSQSNSYAPPLLTLTQRNGSNSITPNGASIGEIRWQGIDAAGAYAEFASIHAEIGTNATGGAPSFLAFKTASSGASDTERMRIDNNGNVGIGTTSPAYQLQVEGTSGNIAVSQLGPNASPAAATFRKARGTAAAPLRVKSADPIASLGVDGAYAADDVTTATYEGAKGFIQVLSPEAWTSTGRGYYTVFKTRTAGTAGAPAERLRISDGGMMTEGLDDKTADFTVINSTSRITLATGTATATLLKTLPAGTASVLVTVAGAAASGVSFAVESGGSLSWGDAGAPTFTNSKTADVVCTSENATATTAAAWRCVKGGNF